MDSSLKSSQWQDWALIALRCAFLVFAGLLLYATPAPDGSPYVSNDIVVAVVLGVVATAILVVLVLFPNFHGALPVAVIVGDWVITAAFVYACHGNATLMVVIGGLVIITSILRLSVWWGILDAIGILAAIIITLGVIYGFESLTIVLNELSIPLLLITAFGVAANVWSFVLQTHIHAQAEHIADIHLNRRSQLDDLRERTRAIYELGAILSSTFNYEKILHAAMNAGAYGLRDLNRRGKDKLVSAVLLFRSKDNELHVVTGRGLARTDEKRSAPGKSGIIGETLEKCMPVFGTSARKDPELQYFVAFQSSRSILCIPLRAGFDNYGVLLFGSDMPDAFTEEHTELLTAIGTQATVALQNAVLYENLLSERDRIVEVEEEARKKLARDLHDGPTQNVAAIAMRMNIIYRILERTPEEVPAELKKVEELARRTTKEIRHMLFTLRPLVLENQGLAAALEQLAEKMKETHNQAVAVRVSRDAEQLLDGHQQGVVFYIVEEAVGNARKHAQASLISVSVMKQEDVILIQISDNGVGFDTSAVEANYDQRGSLGMVNLRERTELLNGTLRIESASGRGTTVTVYVPIQDAPGRTVNKQSAMLASTGSNTKLAAAAMERILRVTPR